MLSESAQSYTSNEQQIWNLDTATAFKSNLLDWSFFCM